MAEPHTQPGEAPQLVHHQQGEAPQLVLDQQSDGQQGDGQRGEAHLPPQHVDLEEASVSNSEDGSSLKNLLHPHCHLSLTL